MIQVNNSSKLPVKIFTNFKEHLQNSSKNFPINKQQKIEIFANVLFLNFIVKFLTEPSSDFLMIEFKHNTVSYKLVKTKMIGPQTNLTFPVD